MKSNNWEQDFYNKYERFFGLIPEWGHLISDIKTLQDQAREEGRQEALAKFAPDVKTADQIRQEERSRILEMIEGMKENVSEHSAWNRALESLKEKLEQNV